MPEAYDEFVRIGQQLESHYRERPGPRVHDRARPPVHAPDARREADRRGRREDRRRHGRRGRRSARSEAVERIEPAQVDQLLRDTFDPAALKGATKIVNGLNASPGAAVGRAVFDADTAVEWVERGEKVILVRIETSPDDFHGMAVAQGIITARGGATSHAAVVARQIGKPCVAGSADLIVDYAGKQAHCNVTGTDFKEGDWVSLDGSTGELYLGRAARPCRGALRGPARAPADPRLGRRDPPDGRLDQRRQARGGRAGPRLRRAGHRPVPHRAHVPRGRPARDRARRHPRRQRRHPRQGEGRRRRRRSPPTSRRPSRPSTPRWPSSRSSSRATSRASSRRWTGCRSSSGSSTRRSTSSCPTSRSSWSRSPGPRSTAAPRRRTRSCSRRSSRCTSRTRCSGLRGCRLGLMIPDFVKIQTRAILNAQIAVRKAGGNPIAKIMIPLVGHVNELVGDARAARGRGRGRPRRRPAASRSTTSSAR